jgi:SAM-dependent methyltransferase
MALIARVEALDSREDHADSLPSMQNGPDIIHEAASILALCAGTASAGTITRTFAFPIRTKNQPSIIKVRLTDVPLDNDDYSSVGAQTWGGACVLAERIVRYPEYFGLIGQDASPDSSDSLQKMQPALRVLELGAGTGLVSLALAKLLESSSDWMNHRTEIIATDFYPPVLENLQNNIAANSETADNEHPQPLVSVVSHFLDWKMFSATVDTPPAPFDLPFDLILGADIIYEAEHAFWIKGCLSRLLRRRQVSQADQGGIFHLVIPLRHTHQAESSTIAHAFPDIQTSGPSHCVEELCILLTEVIVCDTYEDDHEDDIEYVYYRIGWR